jgi:RimJ/RimL family protein N-acetyltransferase
VPPIPLPDPELRDDVVAQRPPRAADAAAIHAACQDPLIQHNTYWAIPALGLARITAEIDVDDTASRRVAQRAGFVPEGVLRSAIEAKGRRWSLAVHSLIAEDLA